MCLFDELNFARSSLKRHRDGHQNPDDFVIFCNRNAFCKILLWNLLASLISAIRHDNNPAFGRQGERIEFPIRAGPSRSWTHTGLVSIWMKDAFHAFP